MVSRVFCTCNFFDSLTKKCNTIMASTIIASTFAVFSSKHSYVSCQAHGSNAPISGECLVADVVQRYSVPLSRCKPTESTRLAGPRIRKGAVP